jgi:hypothetical protein
MIEDELRAKQQHEACYQLRMQVEKLELVPEDREAFQHCIEAICSAIEEMKNILKLPQELALERELWI